LRPTRGSRRTSSPPPANELCPCLALLPMRVAWPPALLPAPVVSYTTFSPLPDPPHTAAEEISGGNLRQIRRSVSVALSAGCPARVLPGIVLCEARTFLRWQRHLRPLGTPMAESILHGTPWRVNARGCIPVRRERGAGVKGPPPFPPETPNPGKNIRGERPPTPESGRWWHTPQRVSSAALSWSLSKATPWRACLNPPVSSHRVDLQVGMAGFTQSHRTPSTAICVRAVRPVRS